MGTQYYQALISAETTAQGLRILDSLMAKQLVLGGPAFNGPKQLIEEAESTSVEQVCMISFVPMAGNGSLIELLEDTFAGRDEPHAHLEIENA
jgi:hypothetical protein